jgi:hypothetical protein
VVERSGQRPHRQSSDAATIRGDLVGNTVIVYVAPVASSAGATIYVGHGSGRAGAGFGGLLGG